MLALTTNIYDILRSIIHYCHSYQTSKFPFIKRSMFPSLFSSGVCNGKERYRKMPDDNNSNISSTVFESLKCFLFLPASICCPCCNNSVGFSPRTLTSKTTPTT